MTLFSKVWWTIILLVCVQSVSYAAIRIKIDKGNVQGIPIAVVPFKIDTSGIGVDGLPHSIAQVVRDDLAASGKFEPIDPNKFVSFPSRNEDVRFKDWRIVNAEVLVIGQIRILSGDQNEVLFRVYDVAREQELGGFRYTASTSRLRNVAHEISDFVYKSVTNRPGAFNSKIAFIRKSQTSASSSIYSLLVADWDGYGEQRVYRSSDPILSPTWSPDVKKLAFVSLSNTGSVVQVIDLITSKRSVIASFKGVNGAPSWSPDGTRLAYSSSKAGSADIYVYDFRTRQHQRLTQHYGIDTEPSWSPDGSHLIFTSNRTGKPQIYRVNSFGGEPRRVTFEGKENANASYDYNGGRITMVSDGGKIVVMNSQTAQLNWLTNAKFDESPSFSHNGDMVLYTSEQDHRPAIVVASTDGRIRTKLGFIRGDVREPAWSPLIQ